MEVWGELDDKLIMNLGVSFLVRVNKCTALQDYRVGYWFIY